jgi:hypothetical protein
VRAAPALSCEMSRESDIKLLREVLSTSNDAERTAWETTAFRDMLTLLEDGERSVLSEKQRRRVVDAIERLKPLRAADVPKGIVTAESRALDAMLAAPKVLRPPPIPRSIPALARSSKRHCGRNDDGCYAFVNGDCACACCR